MLYQELTQIFEILDDRCPDTIVAQLQNLFSAYDCTLECREEQSAARCIFVKLLFPGAEGRTAGGAAPTLGLVGQLGGLAAYPSHTGVVSDGDGAIVALTAGLKLAKMAARGMQTPGDIIVATHICTEAPIVPHDPVAFMGIPMPISRLIAGLVDERMDALLSIDTSKGNRLVNHRGVAITPTAMGGYVLKVSNGMLAIAETVTGELPYVLPITTQDITTYNNGLSHINSIMQPAICCKAPVVGVALTAESAVPGHGTGANYGADMEAAARFCIETAKIFPRDPQLFYDRAEYEKLVSLYGDLSFISKDM